MTLSNSLKKLLISSAALLMFASVGASASTVNVSAKHIHTHRMSHKYNVKRYNHKKNVHAYNVSKLNHRKDVAKWRKYYLAHHGHKTIKRVNKKKRHYADFNPLNLNNFNKLYNVAKTNMFITQDTIKAPTYSPSFVYGYNRAIYENNNGEITLEKNNPEGLENIYTLHLMHNPGYATGKILCGDSVDGQSVSKSLLMNNINLYQSDLNTPANKLKAYGNYIIK